MSSQQFDRFRATRLETLDLISGLSQEQSDFALSVDTWSVGEILDHLARLDRLMRGEFEALIQRGSAGKSAFLYRRLSDFETPLRGMPGWSRRALEALLVLLALLLPRAVRQAILRRRVVPARSPQAVMPQTGRSIGELRHELRTMADLVRRLSEGHRHASPRRLYYYNPLTGFTNLPGLLTLLTGHESRHQEQIRDTMKSVSFPGGRRPVTGPL